MLQNSRRKNTPNAYPYFLRMKTALVGRSRTIKGMFASLKVDIGIIANTVIQYKGILLILRLGR